MSKYTRYNINDGIQDTEHEEWFLIKPVQTNLNQTFISEYIKTIDPEFKYFKKEPITNGGS